MAGSQASRGWGWGGRSANEREGQPPLGTPFGIDRRDESGQPVLGRSQMSRSLRYVLEVSLAILDGGGVWTHWDHV